MALSNQVSGSSVSSSFHPLFPWNGISVGNGWDMQHHQQQVEMTNSKAKEADVLKSTGSRISRLQRRKVASIKHQGPIAHRNLNVTVIPQFAYPTISNGTLIQIPILWTAMSLALGVEIQGEIIRGLPCIKRLNQLFCPTAGNRYPGDSIERFIDENKALIRRMYGEFQTSGTNESENRRRRRSDTEFFLDTSDMSGESIFGGGWAIPSPNRTKRQATSLPTDQKDDPNKSDSCESTVEVVTPYWAANSSGKVRAIVNTQHFEQAVHQEVCSKPSTARCTGDCMCEQKYKWHRLLAYDPDNDCKGIFMDWFLFPSCCVCRCLPLP